MRRGRKLWSNELLCPGIDTFWNGCARGDLLGRFSAFAIRHLLLQGVPNFTNTLITVLDHWLADEMYVPLSARHLKSIQ